MKVIDQLIKALRGAALYNPEVQVAPCCILWPDGDRQWEPAIPRLKAQIPELLVLGDYDPPRKSGPAIWLRCVIEGKLPAVELPPGAVPVLYLPGVSRQDLRLVEEMGESLKPLVELQYRGVFWSQLNTKDWTILAFLKSEQGGLGLDTAQDQETKNAMRLALVSLLDENVKTLQGKRLDSDYFNTLLTGGDPVRDLLQWLDQGDDFKKARGKNRWQAFVAVCSTQFGFNPEKEGLLKGAEKLAFHEGAWRPVWDRFCEAPHLYLNIPDQIRKCKLPEDSILWRTGQGYEGWPQWNEGQENQLQDELRAAGEMAPHEARQRVKDLEKIHSRRRELVWADLGEAQLACALEHLAILAEVTEQALAGGSLEELSAAYQHGGWRADQAVIDTLSQISKRTEQETIFPLIRALYTPWADQSARYLQQIVVQGGYPVEKIDDLSAVPIKEGTCILFVDGLRFDLARQLDGVLKQRGCQVEERAAWAPLPTLTATGKPAVSPVRQQITGMEVDRDFEPSVAKTGHSLKGGYYLKKLLAAAEWIVLNGIKSAKEGRGWSEAGNVDRLGHNLGWKLAGQMDGLIREIADHIIALLDAGWRSVQVVTDHGWLLLPGGLPKIELPSSLVENKWGRCAILKPGAIYEDKLYPWFWNPEINFALAPGIGCYRRGEEYTHGGLSLQECLTLELTVTRDLKSAASALKITALEWRGMRCFVNVEGSGDAGLALDIRTHPGDPTTSVVLSVKKLKMDGTTSVVVDRGELEGTPATAVLLAADGALAAQMDTVIGGGDS